MKSTTLLLLILFYSSGLHSQTLSGYVHDEAEDIPLEGAFVYIDGTTLSASTDSLGFFKIVFKQKFNADLIIKYIGYSDFKISNPYQYQNPVKVLMRETATKLDAVVLNKKKSPFTREEMLKAFRTNFIGTTTRAARSCSIINEDDLDIYYDASTNSLHAKAIKPLQIRNNYLEYNISFDLTEFVAQYKIRTLDANYQSTLYFSGSTFYSDISKRNSAYTRRLKTYKGSTLHLMKTIASGKWEQEHFRLYVNSMRADPNKYFNVTDTLGVKKVTVQQGRRTAKPLNINLSGESVEGLKKKQEKYRKENGIINFEVIYDGKERSFFKCNSSTFYISANGQHFPIAAVRFTGDMAALKVGDMLPADYQ
ncbi:carboxypeptidase-like regulatory domain-containing protein [Flavobacterium litorale]|uniref:Carboxypeptidase-like regulatory domain-containing protein n=1 Tax=Flavobacterium litorale TaxID=2856519 RepID=A0ABX8V8C2_9FLAO|nr:carboxypeptidase-like regulatory domain-containing protein [Flavobacterium litorale]QYJ67281.1 carboxypeptidase-like regulatory domain-containing protein [Flavobacterium litorale]